MNIIIITADRGAHVIPGDGDILLCWAIRSHTILCRHRARTVQVLFSYFVFSLFHRRQRRHATLPYECTYVRRARCDSREKINIDLRSSFVRLYSGARLSIKVTGAASSRVLARYTWTHSLFTYSDGPAVALDRLIHVTSDVFKEVQMVDHRWPELHFLLLLLFKKPIIS